MSFLVIGANGNFSTQFQHIIRSRGSVVLDRRLYRNWDKLDSRLFVEIYKAKSDLNSKYLINTVGVISKKFNDELIMHWNYSFPKYLYQICRDLDLVLVTLGSVHEISDEMLTGNTYLKSKNQLWQFLLSQDFKNSVHFQIHTWYGGNNVHAEMFLGQIINSIKNDIVFRMSDGRQLREYHHVLDDAKCVLNYLELGVSGVKMISHGERLTLEFIATNIFKHFGCENLLQIDHLSSPEFEIRNNDFFPIETTKSTFRPTIEGLIDYVQKHI
jgi:hypothetical protein